MPKGIVLDTMSGDEVSRLCQTIEALANSEKLWGVPWLVAYSGGQDSSLLLFMLYALARQRGQAVLAIHIHHGLHPQADAMAEHAEAWCRQHDIPFVLRRVDESPPAGNREAWAREQRYQLLLEEARAQGGAVVWLAHHQRDQAETVLLRLHRGCGLKGLAAMRSVTRRGGVRLARPWLHAPKAWIASATVEQGLSYIDDASNQDLSYRRNQVRHDLLPALTAGWEEAEAKLCEVAEISGELERWLEGRCAALWSDLYIAEGRALNATALLRHNTTQQRTLLRRWFVELGLQMPSDAQLERLRVDCAGAQSDRQPVWCVEGCEVRRHRGHLYCVRLPVVDVYRHYHTTLPLCDTPLSLPGGGCLTYLRSDDDSSSCVELSLRFWQPGFEGKRVLADGRHQAMKKYFQRRNWPAWLRAYVPLCVTPEGEVVWTGLDGEMVLACGLTIGWQPDPELRRWIGIFCPSALDC